MSQTTSACFLKYPGEAQKGHYPSFAVGETKVQRGRELHFRGARQSHSSLQALETGVVFNGVESLAPASWAEDRRILESWSSRLTQVLFARKMLLLEKHQGDLVEGTMSGTDVD